MSNFYNIVCLLALMLLPLQSQAEKYKSEAHGFEAKFPGKVVKTSGRSEHGLVMTYFLSYAPEEVWAAHVSTAFADPREAADLAQWFRKFIRGMEGKREFTVSTDYKQINFQDRPAVKFDLSADGSKGIGYVILDSDRFFTVVGMGSDEKYRPAIESFIKSFKIFER